MMRSGILVRLKQCSHKRSNSSQTTNATSSSTKQHSHSRPNQPSNASTGSGEPIRPAIQPDSRFSQPGIGTDKSHGRTSHPFQSPRPSYPVKLASPAVSFQLAKPTTSSQLPCFSRVAPATRPTSHLTPVASSQPLRLGCLFWPRRPSYPVKPVRPVTYSAVQNQSPCSVRTASLKAQSLSAKRWETPKDKRRLNLRALLPRRDLRRDKVVVHGAVGRIVEIMVEFVQHFGAGSRSEQ